MSSPPQRNFRKILTRRPGRPRIRLMTKYHRLLEQHIGDRPVSEVAREWGVPHYVLFDGIYENTKSPSARYLPLVAKGMGFTVDQLLHILAPQEVTA